MTDPVSSKAPRGGWRVLLIGSLVLNLLVVGVVAGALVRGDRGLKPPSRIEAAGPYARAMSEADRRAIALRVRQSEAGRAMSLRARRALIEDLVAAISAEPFEPERVAAVLGTLRARADAVSAEVEAALLERLVLMSPEDRAAFADRLLTEVGKNVRAGRDGPPSPDREGGPGRGSD